MYSVRVSVGDSYDTDYVQVLINDSFCQSDIDKSLKVYPIPTQNILNVDFIGYNDVIEIQLFNLNGAQVYSKQIDSQSTLNQINHQINMSEFNKGIYFLRVMNLGNVETKKVMVI